MTKTPMKTLPLRGATQSTLEMPALGYGTFKIRGNDCVASVTKALEVGYRHIDTAQIYDNEAQVGTAIRQSGISRSEVFVTTKIWMTNFEPAAMHRSMAESLEKLQTDYVDLLLLHWPNPDVNLAETLAAFDQLHASGKTRAIGVSNFPVALLEEANAALGDHLACNQVEYHALLSQKPVLDYLRAHDMVMTAYAPLATGKVSHQPLLAEIALKHGKLAGQVALRWLIDQPGVAAIPKAASEANMRANFDIFDFELSAEDYAALNQLNAGGRERLFSPAWAPQWDRAA